MRVGIFCVDIGFTERLTMAAQTAERAGFSAFWFGEHALLFEDYPESTYPYTTGDTGSIPVTLRNPKSMFNDPIVSMTWVAAVTKKIEIGTAIVILPQRNPVVLAKELATLDHLSKGRVLFGVGVGWCKEEYDAVGADWKNRGKRMDEYVGALRSLWNEEASTFHGETVNFARAYSFPKPARNNDIPIIMGGESEIVLKRIARSGDGWLPVGLTLEDAAQKIAHLHALTKEQGRDPATLRIIKTLTTAHTLDDMKRYRDAGVTEFSLRGVDLPKDNDEMTVAIEKLGRYVEMASAL